MILHGRIRVLPALLLTGIAFTFAFLAATPSPVVFTGYKDQKPGVVHKIGVSDLPQPFATKSVDNGPDLVARPKDAWPQAPAGFKVELFAEKLHNPRLLRTAPNGDVFVVESGTG